MAESRGDFSRSSGFNGALKVPQMTWQQIAIDTLLRYWRPLIFVFVWSGMAGAAAGALSANYVTGYPLLVVPALLTFAYLVIGVVIHVKVPFLTAFKVVPARAFVQVSADKKAWANRVRDSWGQTAVHAHLSSSVVTLRQRGPYLKAIQETPEGMCLFVSVARGDAATQLVDAAPNLASAIGVRQLLAAENNQLLVKFVVPAKDALEETISLASVRYGNVSNHALSESLRSAPQASISFGVTSLSKAVVIPLDVAQHYALQGQSRSGKSVALYSLISQLRATPFVQITGVDPTGALPSIHDTTSWVLAGDGGIGVADLSLWLDKIEAILNQRLFDLRQSHYLDKFELNDHKHPLLIIVFEEFPGVLRSLKLAEAGVKPAERVSDRLKAIYGRLLMESAKVNIRTVTVAQRADAEFLGGAERAQIACRITFKVDNQDAVKMFHDGVSGHEWETLRNAAPGVGIIEQIGQPRTIFRAFNIGFPEYRDAAGPMPELVTIADDSAASS